MQRIIQSMFLTLFCSAVLMGKHWNKLTNTAWLTKKSINFASSLDVHIK